MPLPDEKIAAQINQIAEWLLSFEKSKYLFLTPEIALIEEMGKLTHRTIETIITVPCDLEKEAKDRLRNNLPHGISVTVLEEPYFPQSFFPSNGMIVISGYSGGDRAMVLEDTYRMVEHYNDFRGKKAFVPYTELETATRYDGWMEVSQQRFSAKWRGVL